MKKLLLTTFIILFSVNASSSDKVYYGLNGQCKTWDELTRAQKRKNLHISTKDNTTRKHMIGAQRNHSGKSIVLGVMSSPAKAPKDSVIATETTSLGDSLSKVAITGNNKPLTKKGIKESLTAAKQNSSLVDQLKY